MHHADVVVTQYRKHMYLLTVFRVDKLLCYCHNITNLLEKFGEDHIASEWCLFLAFSKRSLKAFLYNGNTKPSVSVVHSVHLKESYGSIEILLNDIQYSDYKWKICGDLKVIGILMGMQ